MRSSEWQPMSTAPLNPYGQAYGPVVLIWCSADGNPWPAYYSPWHGWEHRDCGPAWVIPDQEPPIAPEDAVAWMPIAAPWSEAGKDAEPDKAIRLRIQNDPGPWGYQGQNVQNPAAALALRLVRDSYAMRTAVNAAFGKLHKDRDASKWVSTTEVREALLAALEAIAMEDAEQ